jgi:2-methylcitrate dehydratase PrpD
MSTVARAPNSAPILEAHEPLAARMAQAAAGTTLETLPAEIITKTKVCLFDLIGCAFESRDLPWSKQSVGLATQVPNGATIIGYAGSTTLYDAAFANAVMGHGLVREDMHSGSISHLGIAVLPTLMALSQYRSVRGADFIAAAAVGYEVGGQIGRAVMDAEVARIHRPTGVTGPVAAAAAGARLLKLDVEQTTTAIALGANATAGFNQWAHTGGSEMWFQAGFAGRNGVTAARLAENGAFASPSALDGEAGLFAAFRKRSAAAKVEMFAGLPEMLAVYHKPVPACNFAQTACQAALGVAKETRIKPDAIASIAIRVPRAGALYPGCDYGGPFAHVLQAKMSIQYNVAAALIAGSVSERNFTLLNDATLHRLIGRTTLEVDDAMTRAYPGKQGGEVTVTEVTGATHCIRLEDVVNATGADVRSRFRAAAADALGKPHAEEIEQSIDKLESCDDVGKIVALLAAKG